MSSEQLMILNMVSDGKLTVDEATLLLESIARLEVNDPAPSEESPPQTAIVAEPEPISDTNPETVMPIEPVPDSQVSDSFEEQTRPTRNVWASVKRYMQRFRQACPS